ncbi:hypothetical protein JKP88DRAFT_262856 [Tribonema minus]|uniref:Uncharacterized protein n=1 Tax=Tribonema minus TaxID=303371 RepID=A0A835Z3I1_9STRA|nr:hypothetical protein JKP88DRAFT_262856 [Tribonema minus]
MAATDNGPDDTLQAQVAAANTAAGVADDCEPEQEQPLNDKQRRKLEKQQLKQQKRLKREGKIGGKTKQCTVCGGDKTMLIRCQIDDTGTWHMVCGKCWNGVSGGVTDGDADHPHYRYGGLWRAR